MTGLLGSHVHTYAGLTVVMATLLSCLNDFTITIIIIIITIMLTCMTEV